MDYKIFKDKIEKTSILLKEEEIDIWLIITSEGSDPSLDIITGLKTVGKSAFLFLKDGRNYVICNSIDAGDLEISGLFTEVIKCRISLEEEMKELISKINPNKIALNYSKDNYLSDGLTVGRYRWLQKTMKEYYNGTFVSSELFLTKIV